MDELTERLAAALHEAWAELVSLRDGGMPCPHKRPCIDGTHAVGLTVEPAEYEALLDEVRRARILAGEPVEPWA